MALEKDTTAFLVMDFVNDIVHEKGAFAGLGIPAHVAKQHAIENTKTVIEKARKAGFPVIYVKVEYAAGYPEVKDVPAPIQQMTGQSGALLKGTWGTQIHDALAPLPGEQIFSKSRISPFTNPEFKKVVSAYKTLVLAGVATNFVVESTAREAGDAGYDVVVLSDCCASMNDAMHDFSMQNILPNFGRVMTSADIF